MATPLVGATPFSGGPELFGEDWLGYLEQMKLTEFHKAVFGGIGIHSLEPSKAYTASPLAMFPENPLKS